MGKRSRIATAVLLTAAVGGLGRRLDKSQRMRRKNFAGQSVSLWEGPAVIVGLTTAPLPARIAAVGAGFCGLLDDHLARGADKGLRGHLSALTTGTITTGTVKIAGLCATGLIAAACVDRGSSGPAATVVGAGVIAGCANLINLFDLRPGRAVKVATAIAVPTACLGSDTGLLVCLVAGVAAADDLAGRTMLGDTGANPLGAVAGVAIVELTALPGRLAILALVTALTVASERVSFSRLIEANPVLRRLDHWGGS